MESKVMPWLLLDGIPLSFSAEDLLTICARFGSVRQAYIGTTPDGTPLGFGRIEMASTEEAEAVRLGLDGQAVLDHILSVSHLPSEEPPYHKE